MLNIFCNFFALYQWKTNHTKIVYIFQCQSANQTPRVISLATSTIIACLFVINKTKSSYSELMLIN